MAGCLWTWRRPSEGRGGAHCPKWGGLHWALGWPTLGGWAASLSIRGHLALQYVLAVDQLLHGQLPETSSVEVRNLSPGLWSQYLHFNKTQR